MPAAATQLVILLSVGSFQAVVPEVASQPSATYPDTPQGARAFITWLRPTLPTPKFAQPPMHVCVVGAVPFSDNTAPLLPKPLWESKQPWRSLEPYAATFHYLEPDASAKGTQGRAPKPRSWQQALQICAAAAKTAPREVAIPLVMQPAASAAPAARAASRPAR